MKDDVIVNEHGTFIITDNVKPPRLNTFFVYRPTFQTVQSFVYLFKPRLDNLMKSKNPNGDCSYWEDDAHGHIVRFLDTITRGDLGKDHISNSLNAMGY